MLILWSRDARSPVKDVGGAFENIELDFDCHQMVARDHQFALGIGETVTQHFDVVVIVLPLFERAAQLRHELRLAPQFRLERSLLRYGLGRLLFRLGARSFQVFERTGESLVPSSTTPVRRAASNAAMNRLMKAAWRVYYRGFAGFCGQETSVERPFPFA